MAEDHMDDEDVREDAHEHRELADAGDGNGMWIAVVIIIVVIVALFGLFAGGFFGGEEEDLQENIDVDLEAGTSLLR
ncbi:MAG: hypothetical protein WD850_02165 [Candidatus Spechtbacterales bacterium]